MPKITVNEALKAFGLSDKDIKVYLACLELGTATANEIANKSAINRSTTYDILKAFLEKGVASKITRRKTTHFEVASPKRLVSMLDEKKSKILSVMSNLKLIQERVVKKPLVEVFEGKEGVKTILEDIISTRRPTDVISTSKIFDLFTYYFPLYIKKRKEKDIFARVIQEDSAQTRRLKKKDKGELRETRVLKGMDMNSATFIYGTKIAIIKLKKDEVIGVLISDKTIADDKRNTFEILWSAAR